MDPNTQTSDAPAIDPKTADAILHDIFVVGISVAALFVKNPQSQAHAASIIDLLNRVVLPIADGWLNPSVPANHPNPPAGA